jgi:hypothetical protein
LENVGKVGFVNGISNIIVKNLKALDVVKRPVHCSDSKREVVYVKDENKWEKEDETKQKLRNAIKYIANKNSRLIPEWKANNPDCIYSDSKKSDQYNKIIVEAMGGGLDATINNSENKIELGSNGNLFKKAGEKLLQNVKKAALNEAQRQLNNQ